MKNRFLKIFLLSGVLLTASCESILEVEPKNTLSSSSALSDANSYEAVLISAYDRIQDFAYWGRDMALMGEALSDNTFVEILVAGGRYVAHNTNNQGSHFNIWGQYNTINDLNNIIASIDEKLTTPADLARVPQIKGEALFLRAMVYFDLARVYSYEPTKIPTSGQGAGFDKGVVLRLEPTLSPEDAGPQPRATSTEIYQAIEADLLAAVTLLSKDNASTGKGRFRGNLGAAHALLGKLYLYWEKYASAVTQFDLALSNTSATPITAGGFVTAFKTPPPNKESLFQLKFVQATEVSGVVGVNDSPFSYTQPNGRGGRSTFGGSTPSKELRDLFLAGDDRLGIFSVSATATSGATTYTWCDKFNGSDGQYTDGPIVIRYSDVLLMKAEALAEQGQFTAAQTIVNALRIARGTTAIAPDNIAIINFILDERRRELFFEGHRWFDLKRKGRTITKPVGKGSALAYEDFRLLAPLPTAVVTFNPNLPQNPGY